ncbi:hypothetical protein SAMN05518669_103389 [Variovorax sp. YR634]|uniref:hypothetical protein n=1 Tax=Variovorax sp. YR634 TaxID=1884385 RepID=UPI0008995D46|nr:hypothetical protein [Variovorax sp. YR634]SDX14262.1 hypothetical protein SAMN05518669_103389 [Variovorax sp. YR634]
MRVIRSALLLLAYVLVVVFGVLALASFDANDIAAGVLCSVFAGAAVLGVLKGERALDAQLIDEFEGEFME